MAVSKQYQTTQSELLKVNNIHQKEVAQLNATIVGHVSDKQKMLRERALGGGVNSIPGITPLPVPLFL